MKLAILYGAEPYQAYHLSDIAAELARQPGAELTILTVSDDILPHLERLEAGQFDQPPLHEPLFVAPWTRALRRLRVLGLLKVEVLRHPRNVDRLGQFDAIVTSTTHLALLRDGLPPDLRLVYCYHGAGARAMSYSAKMRAFDLVLPPGQATVDRLIADGLVDASRTAPVGLVKYQTCKRIAARRPPLFHKGLPTVLFNPHSQRRLRSWEAFARPLIDAAARGAFNLIVAPHVKLFARRPRWMWRRWERLAVPGRVHVDLGSAASVDMSYTLAADIYAGDVSSQVYEFLLEPRPCVFLDDHGADWRASRDYPMWELGEVVNTPAAAVTAIARASAEHLRFIERQRAETRVRLGDVDPGAAGRAAAAILRFLRTGAL